MPIRMMKVVSVFLCLVISAMAATTPTSGVSFPMKYEGGSLPLDQHNKLKTTITSTDVLFDQGKQHFVVPMKSITEVSYGSDVHRRVGAAIGLAVVSLGVGALMLLAKTKKHYVGMTWLDPATADKPESKGGIVFKVGKGDYRGFMTALEGKTGLKAVNADAVGSGGTSKP